MAAGRDRVLASLGATLSWLWPGRDGEVVLRLPGVVEIQEVRLGSKVGGRVAEICVVEGQLVEPGQPLVRLEVPELEAKLDQARARLAAAEAALAKATNDPCRQELDAARVAAAAARAQ